MVSSSTLADIFVHASAGPDGDAAPLTPFMIHVWRQHGMRKGALDRNDERQRFVYQFYDTYHESRAPYRLAIPPGTLRWLNAPAIRPHASRYLTRYMAHILEQSQYTADVMQPEEYLRFLCWFAIDYIPSRNLPASLVPSDLVELLNRPVRPPLPLTAAMAARADLNDFAALPDEAVVALSFEMLPELLQTGDARLVPDSVSQFWSRKMSPEADALSAYEYFLLKACRTDSSSESDREWLGRSRPVIPGADLFTTAPSATPAAARTLNSPGKVVVVYRDHHTIAGLSKAGLQTKEALSRSGLDVIDLDFAFGRNRPVEESRHNFARRRCAKSALHVLNLNPEYVPECLMCHLSSLDEADYRIGHFYWELSDTAPIHDCGLALMNEIWVATEYLREVYRQRVSVPVRVMGQAIEIPSPESRFSRSVFNLPGSAYIFGFSFDAGSVVERKNPLATAQAFRKAFPAGEDVALVLKTRNLDVSQSDRDREHWRKLTQIAAADNRIRIIDSTMTAAELTGLLAAYDCYVSLHRSEGFGYGPADAMALGKPVITTNYSGVTDFCTPATALLVDYALERVPVGAYPYIDDSRKYYWASPDIDCAAAHMQKLYSDRALGERLGRAGRQLIRERYSMAALQRRYLSRLAELGWL